MDAAEQWEAKGTLLVDTEALFYRLLEKWKMLVCFMLAGMLIAGIYGFIIAKPQYESTSKIYIKGRDDSAINLSDLQVGAYLTKDYQEMFYTWEVQEMVLKNLGLDYSYGQLSDMLTLTNPSDTRLLNITVTASDPEEAKNIANEFATVASDYIAEMMSTEEPSIISTALASEFPIKPRKKLIVALGMVCGLLLAGIIIVLQFLADDKIKTAADLRMVNLEVLAAIPVNNAGASAGKSKKGH